AHAPQVAQVRAAPPPLPAEAKAKEPIRLSQPLAAPPAASAAARTAHRREGFKPAESDDQYDIPAFLRRGGGQAPRGS
ncbi:MAG TPA: hypothetical protein VIV57_20440, partial [Anaeromyxobacter sp.]